MINTIPIFPVYLFSGRFADPQKILSEVYEKKEQIRQVSESSQDQDHETYKTDYTRPVSILSFEQQLQLFLSEFESEHNARAEVQDYWTAIYSGSGYHNPHTHSNSIFDATNYSGVLYLSEGSGTKFFTPNTSSAQTETIYDAKFGDVVLFPTTLLHCYRPQNTLSTNERYIMSFNLILTGAEKDG